jgi:hypothetical protein
VVQRKREQHRIETVIRKRQLYAGGPAEKGLVDPTDGAHQIVWARVHRHQTGRFFSQLGGNTPVAAPHLEQSWPPENAKFLQLYGF